VLLVSTRHLLATNGMRIPSKLGSADLGASMDDVGDHYGSGNWVVTDGNEAEFIARWTEFLTWTREAAPGLGWARLIQDGDNPRHFISFASWKSLEALRSWRSLPEFPSKMGACRSLCDDFRGGDYTVVVTV
jgi:heme-degrading monooxygenase HmoA